MRYRDIFTSYLRSHIIFRLLVIILFVMTSFGWIIHLIEPEVYPTIFDGIWWAIVTTSTVGYGDYVPQSFIGRSLGISLILLGVGFVTFYLTTFSSTAIKLQNSFNEGRVSYRGDEHLIIIGWNERAKKMIEQLKNLKPLLKIILIDETIDTNPIKMKNVHFIHGDAKQDQTLLKANIKTSKTIIITANQHKNEFQADMESILTLLAVKGLNPSIYSIIEILTPDQVNNANRAGASEIIKTFEVNSHLMINSLLSNGMTSTLVTILDQLKGSKMRFCSINEAYIGLTFEQYSHQLLKEEKVIIGIKRKGETEICPHPSFTIEENDELLVIEH